MSDEEKKFLRALAESAGVPSGDYEFFVEQGRKILKLEDERQETFFYPPSTKCYHGEDMIGEPEKPSKYSCDGKLYPLCKQIALWRAGKGFTTEWSNVPEKLMLIVTELSEAMEAYRKLPADQLRRFAEAAPEEQIPIELNIAKHYPNFKEELADAAIRLFDLAGSLRIDLEEEVIKKMEVNEGRPWKHGKEL